MDGWHDASSVRAMHGNLALPFDGTTTRALGLNFFGIELSVGRFSHVFLLPRSPPTHVGCDVPRPK